MKAFVYGKDKLTSSLVDKIAKGEVKGMVDDSIREKVRKSAGYVQQIVDAGKVVYGINTGFGPLCTTVIDATETRKLQENILKSHAVGVGEPISTELSKYMLILKAHALAQGFSGIRSETLERIIWHIEQDVIPIVPKQGSVGASGDLAPLAHLFLPLIGLGRVWFNGEVRLAGEVLHEFDLSPIHLGAKEGLALINGTQFMAAHAVRAVLTMHRTVSNADLIGTIMLEGLMASSKPFYRQLHDLRPHQGNVFVAQKIHNLLRGSAICSSHLNCSRVQDPYSLRCIPQIHGASWNAWLHLKDIIEIEINAVTDNPIIINEELTISGGSFHGQPIALPIDYATLASSEIGNVSDRRVYLSLEGDTPNVPKLLLKSTGLNSGFMILQYTTAALASENKGLCFPSSADSIPTSLGQEDHVSMGSIGGRKLLQVLDNVENILSIELLCAVQAMDFHRPLASTPIIEAIYQEVRSHIAHIDEDQPMDGIMEAALDLVKGGRLIAIAKETARAHGLAYPVERSTVFEEF